MPPSNGSIPVHSEVGYFRWFSIIRHTVSISIFQNASKCTTSTFSAEINNRKSCRRMRFSSSKYTKMLLRMVNSHEGRKPSSSWTRPPGRPRRTWLNLVQEDNNAIPLSSLWRTEISRSHGAAQRSFRTTRR